MYCIKCNRNLDSESIRYAIVTYHWLNFDEMCFGPFTSSPPPIMTEQDWEWVFAHEPSPEEFALMEQEAQCLSLGM